LRHEHEYDDDLDLDLEIERRHRRDNEKGCCPVDVYEDISISVPVRIDADADVGDIEIKCNGHEIIREKSGRCHRHHNSRKFIIKQNMQVTIPIAFLAECNVGRSTVDFDTP